MAKRGRPVKIREWFFTITLKPEFHELKATDQYKEGRYLIQSAIHEVCSGHNIALNDYYFYPEYTRIGNIHFHGLVTASQTTMYKLYEIWRDTMGHTLYKKATPNARMYIMKHVLNTQHRLKYEGRLGIYSEDIESDLNMERPWMRIFNQTCADILDHKELQRLGEEATEEELKLDFIDD